MIKSTFLALTLSFAALGSPVQATRLDNNVHPWFLAGPSTLSAGSSGSATLTMDGSGSSDTVVTLSSSDSSQLTAPSTVTVPAGSSQVTFTVTASPQGSSSATISATANSSTASCTTFVLR